MLPNTMMNSYHLEFVFENESAPKRKLIKHFFSISDFIPKKDKDNTIDSFDDKGMYDWNSVKNTTCQLIKFSE